METMSNKKKKNYRLVGQVLSTFNIAERLERLPVLQL
jgi:hypothetical protein